MMSIKRMAKYSSVILLITVSTLGGWRFFASKKPKKLYATLHTEKRDIEHVVFATGELEIKGNIKVGALVSGVVRKIFVEPNDRVKKGQILATINTGREDTDVQIARGTYQKACRALDYQKRFLVRQKALYKSGQLSRNAYEQEIRNLGTAEGDVVSARGILEKSEIDYANASVYAPEDGVIVDVGVTEGERVVIDLNATVLFQIGADITKMEGKLEIDESDIGQVKKGQEVFFKVDTYLDKEFQAMLHSVSFSPTRRNNEKFYEATIDVDNAHLLLRPGMTIDASIKVAEAHSVDTITSQAFQVNDETVKKVAKKLEYGCKSLSERASRTEEVSESSNKVKRIWVLKDRCFIQKEITVGLSDEVYVEVKDGLRANEAVVVDVDEPDEMQKIYKNWFGGAL